VQGHGRLAGARPAGDHQAPSSGRAHRLVLLALDGGDDVAHLAGALAADGRQEGAVADDDDARRARPRRGVQQLVVDADDPVATGGHAPRRTTPCGSAAVAR
jgi:hypothetical protein